MWPRFEFYADGMHFRDESADAALFDAALDAVHDSAVLVMDEDTHINDKDLAVRAADLLNDLIATRRMGYALEVEMIRLAHERDLLTAPYVFDVDSAIAMAEAGADILVPHLGLTAGGTIGARTAVALTEAAERVQRMRDAAAAVNPRTFPSAMVCMFVHTRETG